VFSIFSTNILSSTPFPFWPPPTGVFESGKLSIIDSEFYCYEEDDDEDSSLPLKIDVFRIL
jgi:hypothetical protein